MLMTNIPVFANENICKYYKNRQVWKFCAGWISGWEYSTDGKCEKMPSTKLRNVKIKSLPCFEQDGMLWIWPGDDPPSATIPSLQPPAGFQIHAEVCYRSISSWSFQIFLMKLRDCLFMCKCVLTFLRCFHSTVGHRTSSGTWVASW